MTPVPAGTELAVRRMRHEDVDRVVSIETEAFTSPWKADTFLSLIDRPGAELHVLEHADDGLIGYAVLWCVLDQGELANIAIAPDFRGRRYGSELMGRILDVARGRGVESMYLEVRSSNRAAANLYRTFGFAEIGVRRDYYDSPKEDALMMMVRL